MAERKCTTEAPIGKILSEMLNSLDRLIASAAPKPELQAAPEPQAAAPGRA